MRVKTRWVAGGSGLVGGELLRCLAGDDDFETVIALGRRALPRALQRPEVREVRVDFADSATFAGLDAPDAAFCCLGTTIKRAGTREAFMAVDLDAVMTFARVARERGAGVFLHVTALGADPGSSVFYNAVKGKVEAAVARLGFPSVYVARPSILDGDREEPRPLERAGLLLARALGPVLGKYRPTPATAVAAALVASCKEAAPGAHVIEAPALHRFAQ